MSKVYQVVYGKSGARSDPFYDLDQATNEAMNLAYPREKWEIVDEKEYVVATGEGKVWT